MERDIVQTMEFDFFTAGTYDYLMVFFYDLKVNNFKRLNQLDGKDVVDKFMNFCVFLSKLTLYNHEFVTYRTSLVALSILSLGFDFLKVNEMIENIANSFSLRVEHTGGKIYTEVEAVDSMVYVEETHFSNVIFNLMDNAVKYSKPDSPLNIYLRTWNEGGKVKISVRDNGIGIKKENQKKIFEQFYRVHTGNRHDVKGFGLGLAYVKKVIDIHKGTITVDSEYGKGTTFVITIDTINEDDK